MSAAFFAALKNRRSYYPLSKTLPITVDKLQNVVGQAVQLVPSAFNSQTNRAVLLLGAEHDKLWDITSDALKAVVPADAWEATGGKMAMFKGAAGTVLVFEEQNGVKALEEQFPLYAHNFAPWAVQSAGMLELALWTALEAEGLGANLQHYNPLIDAKVAETWNIPANWKLNAQLVFGGKTGEAGPKETKPLSETLRVIGA